MELYSRTISPFAARVRISILAKKLVVHVIDYPDVSSATFARINPYQRVPVLVLDDGTSLPESEVIVEYLEDRYPEVSLRPADPVERSRSRLLARAAELYLFPSVVDVFRARAIAPNDAVQLAKLLEVVEQNLSQLASLIEPSRTSWHSLGNALTLADGALAPFLMYVDMVGRATDRSLLTRHPQLERFWEGARHDPILSIVLAEIGRGMAQARSAQSSATGS